MTKEQEKRLRDLNKAFRSKDHIVVDRLDIVGTFRKATSRDMKNTSPHVKIGDYMYAWEENNYYYNALNNIDNFRIYKLVKTSDLL